MRSQFVPRPDYPERVLCMGTPSLDGETVEMRTISAADEPPGTDFVVSVTDFIWVSMPVLHDSVPEVVRAMFQHYGLVLVACRIVDRQPGYVILEVPAVSGASRISVKPENVARRIESRPK